MDIEQFEQWLHGFYDKQGWSQYGPFIRVGFLVEEVGEIARMVRTLEIGRGRPDETERPSDELRKELVSELGDAISNILALARQYDISLNDIVHTHHGKLIERFANA